ncbi:hypothetical protein GCM10010201_12310 [Pilimelia columellifera subsp. columellifera]|uniref:Alpha/beta hydrolase n=1 Tax=Pilimelia columellifera subsp. columellifera TaxID=706583 RepID=A0ABP6AJH8_9ACTN
MTPQTLCYEPGSALIDVYHGSGDGGPAPTVLLWHGSGPSERRALAPLAAAAAAAGLTVFVPDWRSTDPDGGWSLLAASIDFVRSRGAQFGGDPGGFVLAGWSLGARAAVATLTRPDAAGGWAPAVDIGWRPEQLGDWQPSAVVGLAGSFPQPQRVAELVDAPTPLWLAHGVADQIVPVDDSRQLRDVLSRRGWSVRLDELDVDHAGIVMAGFDESADVCVPATDPVVLDAGAVVVAALAVAAGLAGHGGGDREQGDEPVRQGADRRRVQQRSDAD